MKEQPLSAASCNCIFYKQMINTIFLLVFIAIPGDFHLAAKMKPDNMATLEAMK